MSAPSPARSESSYVHPSNPAADADADDTSSSTASDSPLVLYHPPTAITLLRSAAINLVLPFINGLMLGFGELFAHEIAFRLGWGATRVFPLHRTSTSRPIGPGIEVRQQRRGRTADDQLADLTSLE